MHDARAAVLAALPAHPVFCTDLDDGIVAAALRLDARDQNDGGFPSPDTCFLMLALLETAQATPLGALVDFSPLTILLSARSQGYDRRERDPHDALDCLAQLTMSRGHDITPDDPRADLAIERLLAALHLALFGTLPLSVRGRAPLGCGTCAEDRSCSGPSWIARVVGDAHLAGRLSPAYRPATPLERAASAAEYAGPFSTVREEGVLRLAVRAMELVAALTPQDVARVERWHPVLVERARALGVLAPPLLPAPPALEVA